MSRTSPLQWQTDRANAWAFASATQGSSTDRRVNDRRTVVQVEADLDLAQQRSASNLRSRIHDIRGMGAALKETKAAVDAEVARTSATIVELNAHIRHVNAGPLPTTRENLGARERRAGIDQVVDQVDDELNQELKVIDDCLTILNDALAQAQQELGRLKETSALLAADLASKAEAEHIDHRTHNLQTGMPSLGLYTSTMVHSPPKTVVPSSWVDNSDANIAHAEQDIASSKALDTHIHLTIEDYYVALSNQVKLTDRAFQARIQEVDDARAQDEANIAATQNEIAAQQANIKNLTASIEAKTQPFQLATTRLNTRDTRRGVERTTDAAHHSLVDEAEALDHAIGLLDQRLAASQSSLHDLISTLAELRSDLALKNDTLIIDRRCTKLRQHSAIANKLKPGSIAY